MLKKQSLFPPFATTFDGDPSTCSQHLGRARGMLSLMLRSTPPVKSRIEKAGDAEIRVTTNPNHVYIKVGGIFCTSQDSAQTGCWIYINAFNPKFVLGWKAEDRAWFNPSKGLCVSANSGTISSLDIQGNSYEVTSGNLLSSSLLNKGFAVSAVAHTVIGEDFKTLSLVFTGYNDGIVTPLGATFLVNYMMPDSVRLNLYNIGGFSQDTKKLWLIDRNHDFFQWQFKDATTIETIVDRYLVDEFSTILLNSNSIMETVIDGVDHGDGTSTETRSTTLTSTAQFTECTYVYKDTITILTSQVNVLSDSVSVTTIPFGNITNGESQRNTSFNIRKYKNGSISDVRVFSGLSEHWMKDSVGFNYTQTRTYILYMNAEIDIYVVMTANISDSITDLFMFPSTQHIVIKIIKGSVEKIVFENDVAFDIPSGESWLDNNRLYCPIKINIDSSISSSPRDDTGLTNYFGISDGTVQSYCPMPNINTQVFDGKTIVCCFYACFFVSYLYTGKETLAHPKTLIIKASSLEYQLLNYRVDSPVVGGSGGSWFQNAKAPSVTLYP